MLAEGNAMAKKVAITISGAVSLGSYESGVAFEVLDALAQHNEWAAANNLPDERIEIDVLTGASAGGMTVAMIAQRLLYDGASMSQP
jgi:predicted acylesterase/phospholipase RssA